MGKTLIMLGVTFGFASIIILYGFLVIWMLVSDSWWQKVLCILTMIALPIILIIAGAMITLNS